MSKMVIIFFGPPGSGKGTQAEMLAKALKIPAISPGELFRAEIAGKSALGKKVATTLNKGKLVPDSIVEKIINKRLQKKDAKQGFILDGYPRNRKQLGCLMKKLENLAFKNNIFAVLIKVGDREVRRRLGGRRVCVCGAAYHIIFKPSKRKNVCDLCGGKLTTRTDDKPAVIARRLATYHKEIKPILDYWKKARRLIEINGEQEIEKVGKDINSSIAR